MGTRWYGGGAVAEVVAHIHASEVIGQSGRRVIAPALALLELPFEGVAHTQAVEADTSIADVRRGFVDLRTIAHEVVVSGDGIGEDGRRGSLGRRSSGC